MHEHKLAVRRLDPKSEVATHAAQMGHIFNFDAVEIVGWGGDHTTRQVQEASMSTDRSVNRHISLPPPYLTLRALLAADSHDAGQSGPSVGIMFYFIVSYLISLPAILEYLSPTALNSTLPSSPENEFEQGDIRASESFGQSLSAAIAENISQNFSGSLNPSVLGRSNDSSLEHSRPSFQMVKMQFAEISRNVRGAFTWDLLKQYKASTLEADKIAILEKLQDSLHKFETAEAFAETGGLAELANDLSDVSKPLKTMIVRCLSAAIQGCDPVKKIMFKAGILGQMNSLWRQELISESPSAKFLADCLLVVSSMLRNYPAAQNAFFSERSDTGDSVAFSLLLSTTESPAWTCYDKYCRRLKFRIFRLLGDLIDERSFLCMLTLLAFRHIFSQNYLMEMKAEKRKIYSEFDLPTEIRKHGWCHRVVELVLDSKLLNTHANLESALESGKEIAQACSRKDFFVEDQESEKLAAKLNVLETEYEGLARTDTEDDLAYYEKVRRLVVDFRKAVYGNDSLATPTPIHV
ncbi:hypothetical protein SprV_0501799900 [Sparganum proliferum]